MPTVAKALFLAALTLSCGACSLTSRTKDVVPGFVVALPMNHHCIDDGAGTVLRYSKLRHMPWAPFAYSGWRVTVSIGGSIEAGASWNIPSDASAVLWSISHHPSEPVHDVSGTVRVESVRDGVVTARVNLTSPSGNWRLDGKHRFKPASNISRCGAQPIVQANPVPLRGAA